jgi:hypothetical protein
VSRPSSSANFVPSIAHPSLPPRLCRAARNLISRARHTRPPSRDPLPPRVSGGHPPPCHPRSPASDRRQTSLASSLALRTALDARQHPCRGHSPSGRPRPRNARSARRLPVFRSPALPREVLQRMRPLRSSTFQSTCWLPCSRESTHIPPMTARKQTGSFRYSFNVLLTISPIHYRQCTNHFSAFLLLDEDGCGAVRVHQLAPATSVLRSALGKRDLTSTLDRGAALVNHLHGTLVACGYGDDRALILVRQHDLTGSTALRLAFVDSLLCSRTTTEMPRRRADPRRIGIRSQCTPRLAPGGTHRLTRLIRVRREIRVVGRYAAGRTLRDALWAGLRDRGASGSRDYQCQQNSGHDHTVHLVWLTQRHVTIGRVARLAWTVCVATFASGACGTTTGRPLPSVAARLPPLLAPATPNCV